MPDGAGPPLARLLDVQDHDTVIDQLRHRRATLPERGELANVDRLLGTLEDRTKELRLQRDELGCRQAALEHQIDASRTRRDTIEKRLFGGQVVASRELQAMNEEVKHLARHISELEDREIEVMEALEPLDRELPDGRRDTQRPRQRRARLRTAIAATEQGLDAEIADREPGAAPRRHRASATTSWPATRSCASKLGGTGAARLVGGSCSGCHLALSVDGARPGAQGPPDAVITCEQCGRILVP